jgi:hypothetical protein
VRVQPDPGTPPLSYQEQLMHAPAVEA